MFSAPAKAGLCGKASNKALFLIVDPELQARQEVDGFGGKSGCEKNCKDDDAYDRITEVRPCEVPFVDVP